MNACNKFTILPLLSLIFAGCVTRVEVRHPAPVYAPPPPVVVEAAPPPVVEAPPPAPAEVVINNEADFYEPLQPYGRWDFVPGVGRCWFPTQVGPDWRPYTAGHWERSDAGWFWASDEPWGWATCHYGRWDFRPDSGWFWAPDVHWSPAWVSWRHGEGYVGWAPLPPAARFIPERGIEFDINLIPSRSFVFVEERHFTERMRPATVIVNNTVIVNKTASFANIRVVNHAVVNDGPPAQGIERAAGHSLKPVKAIELRHETESRIAIKPRPAAPPEKHEPVAAPERPAAHQPERQPEKPVANHPAPPEKHERPAAPKPIVAAPPAAPAQPAPHPKPEQHAPAPQKPQPPAAAPKPAVANHPPAHAPTPAEKPAVHADHPAPQKPAPPAKEAPKKTPAPPAHKPASTNQPPSMTNQHT